MKKLITSIVTAIALTSIANAGGKLVEIPQTPAKPVVQDEWSGPYIGAAIGYLNGKGKVYGSTTIQYYSHPGSSTTNYDPMKIKPDGFIGGVFIGANKLFENDWLAGVELALNYTNAKDTKTFAQNGDPVSLKLKLKQQYDAALYARVGKVMGQNKEVMPYLLGGVTIAKLKANLSSYSKSKSDTVTGWTVGAGLEYKINKNWHLRAQYRFSKYGDANFKFISGSNTVDNVKIKDYKTHIFQIGVSYHFK